MEALREIIPGSKLAGVMELPERFRLSDLEVIVIPLQKKEKHVINLDDLPKHDMGKVLAPLDREHF